MTRAEILKAIAEGADLSGADLFGADLSGANLSGAKLSGADLFGADLSGTNLSGADLSGADLFGATLFRTDLSTADLSGANLSGAVLSGADLSEAVGILDAGCDPRGYRHFGIRQDDGVKYGARCRWFTLPQAVAHWTAKGNRDALARVALIQAAVDDGRL